MSTRIGPPVLVLMGVAGTGKSTIAALLAGQLGWPLQEGDDLHPPENIAKMAAGIPLTDEDRWPWLRRVAAWIDARIAAEEPGIVTCSALKRSYRQLLQRPTVTFVHLTGDPELIAQRMLLRQEHFMPPALLGSQLAALEAPGPDERAITVDIAAPPEEQAAQIVSRLRLVGDR